MAFYHEPAFSMGHPGHPSMYFPRAQYPVYMAPQPHPDMMYQNYQFQDFPDYLQPGMMHDDYEDSSEVSTRPRLTKDQVEVLEAQFLSHPKPNSMVKKQLAMQTKLTLPRVANWFQNRRAKAKQQRKQEEYEIQQNLGIKSVWRGETGSLSRKQSPSATSSKTISPGRYQSVSAMDLVDHEVTEPQLPINYNDTAKEASWQSLQRALNAAKAAQRRRAPESSRSATGMPLSETLLPASSFNHFQTIPQLSGGQAVPMDWSTKTDGMEAWTSSSPHQADAGFDFGFDQPAAMSTDEDIALGETNGQDPQPFAVSPDEWQSPYLANTPQAQQRSEYGSMVSPSMPLPIFPTSRRGSGAEELTSNFGTFALQGTPPTGLAHLNEPLSIRPAEGEIDLASRRRRPRPAALTSSSLRSRSYGALSSTSPAFRAGTLNHGQLRHAKSAGHSLNTQYAGIRKSSTQSKSPLNIHSFAEADTAKAEAFKELMAQQAAATTASTPQTAYATTEHTFPGGTRVAENTNTTMQPPSDIISQYKQLQSPPITPFQQDFMMQSSGMGIQPAVSTASQFATLADYTPPYSAGPLTNSTCSWSDAPLQSPDISVFPSGTFMSSLGFNQDPTFQPWAIPTDAAPESGINLNMTDDKKTEFYITEFPGQKEEHLNVFQKLSQQKPKNYVFANTAPSDYDP